MNLDAVYGSIDPNSGTAILSELARAMVQTMNETGWKPARSIVFNSWDAEEYGLIGSTEFVEEFDEILRQRAVVYINMDCLHMNHTIGVRTTPELYQIITETTKTIPNFSEKERRAGRMSLYDTFIKTSPRNDSLFPNIPQMDTPGGGIPVIDFSSANKSQSNDDYPLYHTLYETPFTNEHLLDVDNFAEFYNTTLTFDTNKQFAYYAFAQNPFDSRSISGINERQMGISRCFINPRGIPNAPESRHVLFSMSAENSYAGKVMTGVFDAIDEYKRAKTSEEKQKAASDIAEQLSVVQYSINCAIRTLKDVI
ncbi:hypothetical protein WR25_12246 [Diploscapter pachys]|uniref:Peptidase M28 domain-containing protein n=1 Tax=Diploscapter pachys TaxID=2018661 RepID=A0A2A2LEH4_9BILA|nr:hypothetical protein WR25_12246 [Diploscapter pachys]